MNGLEVGLFKVADFPDENQARSLDRGYIDPLVEQLAKALERPDIATFYRDCLRKAGADPSGPPDTHVPEDPHG